jgi:choline dehydrogenase-like flavoprotein
MNQREVEMMPLLWKNGGANFTDNLRMVIAQGECLGGSTVINDAVCFKTPPIVREQWRSMGVNISDNEWDKAIDEVWGTIHVSRVKDYELNENNLMLKRACELKGYKSAPNDRNCLECRQCGFCHIGCHYETKQDMRVTYIHKALSVATDFRVYCNCQADRITYSNGVADGVEANFIDKRNGNVIKYRIRVNAKLIVISAGAIASSQLLLKNAIATKTAGKGLSFHPASFLLGKFEKEINAYDGIPMAYTCHEFGVTNGVQSGGFLIESIFLPIFQFSLGVPSFAEEHQLFMKDYTHYAMAGIMMRDSPVGKVSLTASGNARVEYDPADDDMKMFAKGLKVLAEMWFDVGAIEVVTGHRDRIRLQNRSDIDDLVKAVESDPNGLQLASAHPQGGNRMGEDPNQCVVDSNCKVHGFDNLFVCDASVFPTAVGVNPQITIMALATITADFINKKWDGEYADLPIKSSLGETCSILQPMHCSSQRLETMFSRVTNQMPIETMINADEGIPLSSPNRWSFDKDTLTIFNDNHWKGFFSTDYDAASTLIKYFGGFWKFFFVKDGMIKGITHPYDAPVFADNIPELKAHERYGEVIHLKYTGPQFSQFYDLLKIVDKDTIIGKAFFGIYPSGTQILVFSMSRKYSVYFMTKKDHEMIYSNHANVPSADQVLGRWTGRLVSDSAPTPHVLTFTYTKNNSGKLKMDYNFGGLLSGISRVELTPQQMNMYDYTNWHDEVKLVTPNIMVGKWCSPPTQVPLDIGPSFLDVERVPGEGRRFCLRFILERRG